MPDNEFPVTQMVVGFFAGLFFAITMAETAFKKENKLDKLHFAITSTALGVAIAPFIWRKK